ncbi:amidohydrolase family protein [Sphingobium sp.]|uniref:amidohydrolase family protein n=1 Tax=Sphingobium sp. TaxID=1912891 RepID=UPI002B59FA42|nr:amidohydrolase family protein [Sphingobium sp.]HUD94204.1 amidohydrolase family protein [Sphingobium sp.]
MSRSACAAVATMAALLSAPAFAQSIAITGATLAIGDGSEPIQNGTVVITGGKVVAAGAGVAVPAGAKTVDASGKWVTPGLVSGYSRVGLVEVPGVKQTNDTRARSPFSAAIDVAPAINPLANPIAVSRTAGITRAVVVPATGVGIFAGQGAVVDLGADLNPITKARAFQYVEMGESGAEDAGGSRAAAILTFKTMLREAQDYAKAPASYDGRSRDALLNRVDAEALVPVVTGAMPLMIHAESARDIVSVLALRQDFPALKLILAGAAEGWMVATQIAAAKVPVIAGGLDDLPSSFEKLAATQSNVGRMVKAGVAVSMGLMDRDEGLQLRLATQQAGNMVALNKVPGATGLSWGQALRTITSAPAEAMGLGDRIGSLKAGKAGDVVIWDGDPLEMTSAPVAVWIDGVQQPIENRQTKLRDRYATPTEGAMPKAYEW